MVSPYITRRGDIWVIRASYPLLHLAQEHGSIHSEGRFSLEFIYFTLDYDVQYSYSFSYNKIWRQVFRASGF